MQQSFIHLHMHINSQILFNFPSKPLQIKPVYKNKFLEIDATPY